MLKTRLFAIEKLSAAILFSLLVGYLSFIDPPLGGFGEIFPEVMIFPEGFSPREKPSGNIITSGNISPNPPSGKSINLYRNTKMFMQNLKMIHAY